MRIIKTTFISYSSNLCKGFKPGAQKSGASLSILR